MFDALVEDLSQRYGLGDRGRDLFGLLVAYLHNDRRGGFGGFIEGFREQGHGDLVSSWLGNPEAGGLNASDVGMVFGQGLLNDWGTRLGVSRATVAAAIAGVLPRLVAELTPGGRVPGGYAAPAPLHSEAALPARAAVRETPVSTPATTHINALSEGNDRGVISAREPSSPAPFAPPERTPARQEDDRTDAYRPDPLFDTPAPPQHAASLRREPTLSPAAPRAPVQARPALDPGEQRAADMAAAFDRPMRGERAPTGTLADVRPDNWRSAMQAPRRKRGPSGLFWFVLLLALLGGAAWFAWTQGMLAPYIEQYRLPIRSAPSVT
jgi:uncharacterized protein YidB (DUF937 family)